LCVVGAGAQSAWAISCQVWPLARASCTKCGRRPFGLLDQAGDQGHRGEVVAKPDPAAGGEGGQGVVDQVEGVITASRAWIAAAGHGRQSSCPHRMIAVLSEAVAVCRPCGSPSGGRRDAAPPPPMPASGRRLISLGRALAARAERSGVGMGFP
jgi:hypothetical protein